MAVSPPKQSGTAALPGRAEAVAVPARHPVLGGSLVGPFPDRRSLVLGMGCFWGAEKLFWSVPGVASTHVGYAGGSTPNPTYEEVCSGRTGHAEVVRVVFDAAQVRLGALLTRFWEGHDPTQGMRQGNDRGSQYRSALYLMDEADLTAARASAAAYGGALAAAGMGPITTEIGLQPAFFYAEAYHQQYLHKNPQGYCGHGGTGVRCPT